MSALTAVIHIGSRPPLGSGITPSHVAHCYGTEWPQFVLYEVGPANGDGNGTDSDGDEDSRTESGSEDGGAAGPDLRWLPGAYAPAFEAERSYPLTDLLLAAAPRKSAVGDLLGALDTKARANYGVGFREKVLEADVSRGSPAYGRLFEARSQLEAHPYNGAIVVGTHAGVAPAVSDGLRANAARIDADIEVLEPMSSRRAER
jgi:hypothetical protein